MSTKILGHQIITTFDIEESNHKKADFQTQGQDMYKRFDLNSGPFWSKVMC